MRGIEFACWGAIGTNPELRTSKSGKPFVNFNLAVTVGQDDDGKPRNSVGPHRHLRRPRPTIC